MSKMLQRSCQMMSSIGFHQTKCIWTTATPRRLLRLNHLKPSQIVGSASSFCTSSSRQQDVEKRYSIYTGTLASQVKFVKAFSLSTSIVGLSIQPYLIQHATGVSSALMYGLSGIVSFFIFLTPLMLHYITKRYVTDISYSKESGEFSAKTYTFFLREKEHKFTNKDVRLLSSPRLFATLYVNDQPMFIDPSLFTDKEVGARLLGYDQPIDWEMNNRDK